MSVELRRSIQELETKRTTLIEARDRALADYNAQLAAPPAYFDQTAVNESRAALRRLDDQIARIDERLAALRAQLPSPSAVAAAQERAEDELRRAYDVRRRFPDSAARFIEALESAVATGRELVALKAAAATAVGTVRDLANTYDLAVRVPDVLTLPMHDARVCTNLAAALVELAAGDQPSQVTESHLAAARAERGRAALSV